MLLLKLLENFNQNKVNNWDTYLNLGLIGKGKIFKI